MTTEFFLIAVIILIAFAVFDLMVGVSNDAVNFLNSSIGSKVAPRYVIMIIASLGILAGVTFSSGMMEVARKGIFHPHLFTMPELLTIFLAVMLTDIILLDFFNTFGLPTSTTVSIVFELLGAAVIVSIVKIISAEGSLLALGDYINTAKAMIIIGGILLSIIVAFFFGAFAQLLSRLLFSFDFMPRLKRYGAIWSGLAMAMIFYFILVKGSKGASFISSETAATIKANAWVIMFWAFVASAVIFQILMFLKVNILKPLILVGTFALAMAFAANDLVNFIGVPLAGLTSYQNAMASDSPLTVTMAALSKKVQTDTWLLVLAGLIMVVTLWVSRKARTVTETEVSLGQQEEGTERFESAYISRIIVRMWLRVMDMTRLLIPASVRASINRRLDPEKYSSNSHQQVEGQRFDLIRASVNLMVASAVISYATSYKLPLSTTYVTFMVAMGTSFADRAWGRESAVYRITGVLTVIGGWFMTAISAFIISGLMAALFLFTNMYAVPVMVIGIGWIIWKSHKKHGEREESIQQSKIFNLKKIKDAPASISTTFEQMGLLIKELRGSLNTSLTALFEQNLGVLKGESRRVKRIQNWCNIIVANIFKSMRLLQKSEGDLSFRYAYTIRKLQTLADCYRDTVIRAKMHVDNQHKGLIRDQITDLQKVKKLINDIFLEVESTFNKRQSVDYNSVLEKDGKLIKLARELNEKQIARIVSEESKTRLSILYYAIIENSLILSKQALELIETFQQSFGQVKPILDLDKIKAPLEFPALALEHVIKGIVKMAELSKETVKCAQEGFFKENEGLLKQAQENESTLDSYQQAITHYLIKISEKSLDARESSEFPALLHSVNDLEKIGDYAVTIAGYAGPKIKHKMMLSDDGTNHLNSMFQKLYDLFDVVVASLNNRDSQLALDAIQLEDEIDAMKLKCREIYTKRLKNNIGSTESEIMVMDLATNIEKMGGHLFSIAKAVSKDLKWGMKKHPIEKEPVHSPWG